MTVSDEDDATIQALRRFVDQGSDLTRPMTIDFFVAVPNGEAGNHVAIRARQLGFTTSVEQDEAAEWTCYCTKVIVPGFEDVRATERQLDQIAREVGGHADGFGSFGNAIGPS